MHFATAQDTYRALVNAHLSPALRNLGFKGSAGRYQRPSETHWALLELQKSAYSDRDEIRFTANLFVVPCRLWQQSGTRTSIQSLKPVPGAHWDMDDEARLGQLADADDIDVWWSLTPVTDLSELSASFVCDLTTHGLPWMDARLRPSQA
jgi:hypothetical protein